jgi:phage tail-like protein
MTTSGNHEDLYSTFNFTVELDELGEVAGFSECSGLSTDNDTRDYRNRGKDTADSKLPRPKTFTDISLKRGLFDRAALRKWEKSLLDGNIERKGGAIVLRNEAREETLRWTFREAWPIKLMGPSLNAKGDAVAIESLEIAAEGIKLDDEAHQ